MSVIVAIPARLKSTRFPGKVLADIQGKPMLWYVHQAALNAQLIEDVWVLTDTQEVLDAVTSWGGKGLLTSEDCPTGTDRIASVVDSLEADIIVNVQGDEPLLPSSVIDRLVDGLQNSTAQVTTPVYPITNLEDLNSPNVVKAVRGADGTALYFSRSPIPHVRDSDPEDWMSHDRFWGHAGVYAYDRSVLLEYSSIPQGRLEEIENLEQLRLLETGYRILTVEIDYRPIAVDVPSDLETVNKFLRARSGPPQ